jgi:hypothetical protein
MDLVQKYSVNNYPVEIVLNWYRSKEIAIPEIQRPFIWDSTKVRNLLDSLYQGYPIGYLIVWRNPNVKLKDGSSSEGKKILIDGQQRVMALITSLLAQDVVNKDYKKMRIAISFNPQTETFEVLNPAIQKDVSWIQDVSPIVKGEARISKVIADYCDRNSSANKEIVEDSIENLKKIMSRPIGYIELTHDLDIETVTEIFIRINSAGVPLNQADFAMSKIASNEAFNGTTLRKCIDYFCHLMRAPESFDSLRNGDSVFAATEFFQKISWLRNESEDLYEPTYSDMLRVAFTSEFNRGKLADLVSLLSGRNFETRAYEEEIAKESFKKLGEGLLKFVNESNFKRFLMIIKSAGFTSSDLIRSQNAVNFAYILYLKLRSQDYNPADIETYIRKWFVLSILTERYSASPESQFDFDIRNISSRNFRDFLTDVEAGELSEAYWNNTLIQSLKTPVASSPYFNVFLAAQVKFNHKGFLSKDITVKDMIDQRGDIHHIFPKEYLKSQGFKREDYNQIANYVYAQTEINVKVGKKSPKEYFSEILKQCNGGELSFGGICNMTSLKENFEANCIPEQIFNMEAKDYSKFLEMRRLMIGKKIKEYYNSL